METLSNRPKAFPLRGAEAPGKQSSGLFSAKAGRQPTDGVRRGTSLTQCDGDHSRLTDEVLSWLCDKLFLRRSAGTPHPSRANGLGHSLHLDSARPTFPSRGRLLVRDLKRHEINARKIRDNLISPQSTAGWPRSGQPRPTGFFSCSDRRKTGAGFSSCCGRVLLEGRAAFLG